MTQLPEALSRVYQRYAEVDRARGDYRYLRAMESLIGFYEQIGDDSATLETAIDALIEDFENKQMQIVTLLERRDFGKLKNVVQELQSSIRHVVDEDVLENARDIQRASSDHNLPQAYNAWSILHEKLYPVFLMLRQLRRLG